MEENNNYAIEMIGITKEFPGIIANDNVTIRLKHGEILALLGENGAGKSTLMSVLFGMYTPEKGIIKKDGKEITIKNPNDATKYKIGMVHQHFMLIDVFTVLDNIILGAEPNEIGFVKRKEAKEKISKICKKYGFDLDLNSKIEDLTIGAQQKVEILKMLYRENDILIFDEPTAVLTPQEIEELMLIMKNLVKEGKSIIFITHKLDEIMKVADECTVLRKGKVTCTVKVKDTNKEELSEMMVGRKVELKLDKKPYNPGKVILEVKNLTMHDKARKIDTVKNVSFEVHAGEILCIAGIDGNGQSELIGGITGLLPIKSGSILLDGENITKDSIRKRNNLGISHIPEDRHKFGLVLDYSLEENLILQKYFYHDYQKFTWINKKNREKYADNLIGLFDIRSGQGKNTKVRSMSGGNQQKAIVAREIERDTDLLIAAQPTRGLDVGAIEYIHRQLLKQRDSGKAVLLVSLELEEVFGLADRILVMHGGEIVAECDPNKVTVNELGLYMGGVKQDRFKEENNDEK
ncbi:MAG TPA: heme ABC transporter ATP-binding protein [Clostridiales bacterium]|nr:heme ABC transporter ATP-binding protein [Clostridiales bacterium]